MKYQSQISKFIQNIGTSKGVPLLLGGIIEPTPLPLGYLKQQGRSLMAAAVATMCMSSVSSEGAMTTILGKQAMKVVSNAPQCVGPSAPTRPALSIANLTGSFWRSTSWATCVTSTQCNIRYLVTEVRLVSFYKLHKFIKCARFCITWSKPLCRKLE